MGYSPFGKIFLGQIGFLPITVVDVLNVDGWRSYE
jgi:hypothetical protein